MFLTFMGKIINLYRFFQTFEKYEIFYKVDMSLTAKPDRNLSDSSCHCHLFMNTDAQIYLTKIVTN